MKAPFEAFDMKNYLKEAERTQHKVHQGAETLVGLTK